MVSLIIPVYNNYSLLKQALESALSFKCVKQILIINDGSSDKGTTEYEKLCNIDERISVLTHFNNENKGISHSRNLGVTHSTQKYIAFLDSDDIYIEGRFNLEIEDGFNSDVYFQPTINISREGEELDTYRFGNCSENKLVDKFLGLIPNSSSFVHLNGITIKKEIIDKVGGFEYLKVGEDVNLLIKISAKLKTYKFQNDIVVSHRRYHDNNTTYIMDDKVYVDKAYGYLKLIKDYEEIASCERYKDELLRRVSYNLSTINTRYFRKKNNASFFEKVDHYLNRILNFGNSK